MKLKSSSLLAILAFFSIASAFDAHVLNVGYGLSVFLEHDYGTGYLVDAGPNRSDDHLIDFIEDQSIDTLYALILTHPDADHIGEAEDLIRSGAVHIKCIIKNQDTSTTQTYLNLMAAIQDSGIPVKILTQDTTIANGTDTLKIYVANSPTAGDVNRRSLVCKWKSDPMGMKMLIMGDADSARETELVQKSDFYGSLIVLGHHGSNTSTSNTLLYDFTIMAAFISVGTNSYGHPAPEVISRLNALSINKYRTDQLGDIRITVSNQGMISATGNGFSRITFRPAMAAKISQAQSGHFNAMGQSVSTKSNGFLVRPFKKQLQLGKN